MLLKGWDIKLFERWRLVVEIFNIGSMSWAILYEVQISGEYKAVFWLEQKERFEDPVFVKQVGKWWASYI